MILLLIPVFVLQAWLFWRIYDLGNSIDKELNGELGSVSQSVEALAKRIEELVPDIEWNRDPKTGWITGIVHEIEVNFVGEGGSGMKT